ncbi:MAG: universal stress protein [Burkholderiales bacterium]
MSYKRILVPVDGSTPASRGLAEAVRLAKAGKSRLMLLHVVQEYSALAMPGAGVSIGPMLDAMKDGGKRVLAKSLKFAERAGVKPQTALVENAVGGITGTVLREARRWKADLIVVGSHSRTGVKRVLMGSDAESIARESPVPVLVVPSGKKR